MGWGREGGLEGCPEMGESGDAMLKIGIMGLWGMAAGLAWGQTPSGSGMGVVPASPARADGAVAGAVVATTNSMEVLDATRPLQKGDVLSYRVVEERRVPIPLFVTDSGEVEVPLIGRVAALGKTCRELAYGIKAPLEREYFHKATVIVGLDQVGTRSGGRIYLSGQVRSQGPMEIPGDEEFTLSKAILRAGGLADFANSRKIKLIRKREDGSTETTVIDFDEIVKKGRYEKDPVLKPEDRVVVPEKFVNF
jgi:polysaccharide export outer membrane protein